MNDGTEPDSARDTVGPADRQRRPVGRSAHFMVRRSRRPRAAARRSPMWRSLLAVVTTMIFAALPPFAVGVVSIQIGQSFDFGMTHLGIGIAGF